MAGMCTTWGREVAVLEAQWGAIAATPLIWAAKRLNSPVTKQWELLGGNEQDSIPGKDQTKGAW